MKMKKDATLDECIDRINGILADYDSKTKTVESNIKRVEELERRNETLKAMAGSVVKAEEIDDIGKEIRINDQEIELLRFRHDPWCAQAEALKESIRPAVLAALAQYKIIAKAELREVEKILESIFSPFFQDGSFLQTTVSRTRVVAALFREVQWAADTNMFEHRSPDQVLKAARILSARAARLKETASVLPADLAAVVRNLRAEKPVTQKA